MKMGIDADPACMVTDSQARKSQEKPGKYLKLIHAKKKKISAKCTSRPHSKAPKLEGTSGPKGQALY